MYCDCVVRRSLRVEVEVETRECHQQPPFPARLSQLSVLRCGVVWCGHPGTTRSVSVSVTQSASHLVLLLLLLLLLSLLDLLVLLWSWW